MGTFRFTRAQEATPRQGAWSGVGQGMGGISDSIGEYLKDLGDAEAAKAKAKMAAEQRGYDRDRDIIGDEHRAAGLAQQKRVSDAQAKNFEMKNAQAQAKMDRDQEVRDQETARQQDKDQSLSALMNIVAEKGINPKKINDEAQRNSFIKALSESGAVKYMDEVNDVFNLTKSYQAYLTPAQKLAQTKAGRGGSGKKALDKTGADSLYSLLTQLGNNMDLSQAKAQKGLISPADQRKDLGQRAGQLRTVSDKLIDYISNNPNHRFTTEQVNKITSWGMKLKGMPLVETK